LLILEGFQDKLIYNKVLRGENRFAEEGHLLFMGPFEGVDRLPATLLARAFLALPKDLRGTRQLILAGDLSGAAGKELREIATASGGTINFRHMPSRAERDHLIEDAALIVDLGQQSGPNGITAQVMAAGRPVLGSSKSWLSWVLAGSGGIFKPSEMDLKRSLGRLMVPGALATLASAQAEKSAHIDWQESALHLLYALRGRVQPAPQTGPPAWSAVQSRLNQLETKAAATLRAQLDREEASNVGRAATARALAEARRLVEEAHRAPGLCAEPARQWRLEGPFDSSYSLAVVNRETARALERAHWEVALFSAEGPGPYAADIAYLEGHPDLAPLQARAEEVGETQADVVSRNMYPPRCDDMVGRMNLLHGYAWEESGFPADYVRDINHQLQGLLVTSPHVKRVLINAGVTPPIAVTGNGLDHLAREAAPLPFSMPQDKFLILHVSSCFPRKGADVLLEAFARAFSGDRMAAAEVCLVIKTFENPHNDIAEEVAALRLAHPILPQIRIETDDLAPAQMRALYEAADLLVAPSRAEGFCLPVAEAILVGTPALTTGWSGQMVFAGNPMVTLINYSFAPAQSHLGTSDSVWAEPDVADLARKLRTARITPPDEDTRRAGAAAIQAVHNWDAVAQKSTAAVDRWVRAPRAAPPRIGWVSTWNTRCGIATYSGHLLAALPDRVTLLGNHSLDLQGPDGPEVRRCWTEGKDDDLSDLRAQIEAENLDLVVIQFNYGFFRFDALGRLILWLKSTGRRVVLMMHGTDDRPHPPTSRLAEIKSELAFCDRLLVHSHHDLNRLKGLGLVDNVALFPHGVPENWASSAPPLTPDGRVVIGTYGFLLPHKGYPELIETLALLRDAGDEVELRMINAEYPAPVSATLARELRARIADLGLQDRISLCTDFLDDLESVQRLSEAHLLVFPYRTTTESASGAVRQALAVSRPIAVTPQPIFDDVRGLVAPLPGFSAEEMAVGLQSMIAELRKGTKDGDLAESLVRADAWRRRTGYAPLARRLWSMLFALHRQ
jgi:glycosyltransferase involved in cell wall biosynthesis